MALGRRRHLGRKLAVGSIIAGTAGYLAGVLTAPKSGKETRKDLAHKANEIKLDIEDELHDLNEELKELLKKAKVKTFAASSSAKAEFSEAVIRAKDTQNKTSQVLKAVKKGEAADPDLNKAIKQAQLAIKNLSKYLKN